MCYPRFSKASPRETKRGSSVQGRGWTPEAGAGSGICLFELHLWQLCHHTQNPQSHVPQLENTRTTRLMGP